MRLSSLPGTAILHDCGHVDEGKVFHVFTVTEKRGGIWGSSRHAPPVLSQELFPIFILTLSSSHSFLNSSCSLLSCSSIFLPWVLLTLFPYPAAPPVFLPPSL